jgi:hypothetical protein
MNDLGHFDLTRPIQIDRQFDLVVSLEVAEHLPKSCAKTFIRSLTKLGPVILFSAAIPFQGGTAHLNEQWPDYWANYFKDNGYAAIDCLRKRVWQDDKLDWWYAQNILVFSRKDYLASNPLLKEEFKNTHPSQLSIVHPRKYLELIRIQLTAQDIANLIPKEDRFILVDQEQLRELMALEWPPFSDKLPGTAPRKVLAISVINLHDVLNQHNPFFRWLCRRKPVAKIGYSIFVYDLTNDQEGLMKLEETYVKAGISLPP